MVADRRPPSFFEAFALLGVGILLLSSAGALPASPPMRDGLRLGGFALSLAGMGALLWGLALRTQRTVILRAAAEAGKAGPGAVCVSSTDGAVLYRNAVAHEHKGAHVTHLLQDWAASPEVLFRRLRAEARRIGTASEDIGTRRGILTLTARDIGAGLLHWRFVLADQGATPSANAIELPLAMISPSGAVIYCNPSMVDLLGSRPANVAEFVEEQSLRNGAIATLKTAAGRQKMLVARVEAAHNQTQICFLPRETSGASTSTNWELVDDLPVALLKISASGQVLSANRHARRLLRSDLAAGTRLTDVLAGLGRPMDDWLKEAMQSPLGAKPQFLRGVGENRDRVIQVNLCHSTGAGEQHLIGVLNNATEFKDLEAQFVQSQKMQAIGQLAGGVAHDFNNLLTAIAGHCDLLLARHEDGDSDFPDLTQIRQNTNRAAGLVRQLLAFSRKQDLTFETLDLRDTLADLTHLLNRLVGERVKLSLVHDPAALTVLADKRQLEQVVMNLVVNARDAMPDGGEIRIEAENLHLPVPLTRDRATVQPGDYVVIRVVDEGCGIPAEMLSHVFEPFYTTKGVGEGTGLGLSTAYGIVKQMSGFTFIDSEVGKGSIFSIYLPAQEEPPLEITRAEPEETPALRVGGVVLLVEDEAPVRAFAARALTLKGYEVIEADSGEAALRHLEDPSLKVDLFVTDVVMPGLDGPGWVRKALEARPGTRTLFMSGYSEDSLRETRKGIDNSSFLPKPFALKDLIDTVEAQLIAVRSTRLREGGA